MAENSAIEWTDYTLNPWSGCSKVSEGCKNCYAEVNYSVKMRGVKWGPKGNRIVMAESGWKKPLKWDCDAAKAGERRRVFCASLADVFEDWQGPILGANGEQVWICGEGWFCGTANEANQLPTQAGVRALTMSDVRARLFRLIDATPNLDWLLLTKRPENIARMMPAYFPGYIAEAGAMNQEGARPNVWLGVSVEDQQRADERIPLLLQASAAVRFLSCEPLLGPVDLTAHKPPCVPSWWQGDLNPLSRIDWVIVGSESGHKRRPMEESWARSLADQCRAAGVSFFMKQMQVDGKVTGEIGEFPSDLQIREFPHVEATT